MKKLILTFAGLFLAAAICPASEVPSAEHVKWMKDLGAQNGAIRKGVDVAKNAGQSPPSPKGPVLAGTKQSDNPNFADSGARRKGFRGEREKDSGVKTNGIPG